MRLIFEDDSEGDHVTFLRVAEEFTGHYLKIGVLVLSGGHKGLNEPRILQIFPLRSDRFKSAQKFLKLLARHKFEVFWPPGNGSITVQSIFRVHGELL